MDRALTQRRWTRAEFERAVDVGLIDEDDPVELLDGEIVFVSPEKSAHSTTTGAIQDQLRRVFRRGCVIRCQHPLSIDGVSLPEPDVAVVEGTLRTYARRHPRRALLVVEVSDWSLRRDLEQKAAIYARNGIEDYWVADVRKRVLHVHRNPGKDGYANASILGIRERVRPLARPRASIKVADLFF